MESADVKKWRTRQGLTQVRLAEKLNVSKDAVASWETGRRPIPKMLELALRALEQQIRQGEG